MAARLCALRAHITAPPPRLPTTRTRQTSHETPTLQLPPNYETPDHTNKSRTSADWRLAQPVPDAGFDDQLSAPHVCDQCGRMKARTGAADRSRRCRPQASDLRRSFQVKRRPRYVEDSPSARIFLLPYWPRRSHRRRHWPDATSRKISPPAKKELGPMIMLHN